LEATNFFHLIRGCGVKDLSLSRLSFQPFEEFFVERHLSAYFREHVPSTV